jgi:heptosyltransferase I
MMSAVGDAVHVLPVITALKRHAPQSRISWVLQPAPASLVRGHPAVDEIIPFDPALGARAFLAVRRALAGRAFDLVLDLQVALKAGLVTAMTRAPVKLGFDRARARDFNWLFTNRRIRPGPRQHVQDQYFEFLAALGVSPEPVRWEIGPWPDERAWQRQFFAEFTRPAAAIAVATSRADKDWPAERWAEVVDALHERFNLEPVLIGGRSPREQRAEGVILARARHRPRSALGSGLRRLVSILDGAALVLTPDTAPLHIAVALDRPVISLMGSTDPRRAGPYRKYDDLVVDAFREPSDGDRVVWERRPGRMARIAVSDVLEKVELWQRRYRDRGDR